MSARTSAVFGYIVGVLGGAALALAFTHRGDDITGVHGVLSPCGFFNIVTIHADGTHRSHPDSPPSPEVMAEINELPAAQRSITQVPCPTMQVPQREAKSKNTPVSRQAHEAPRDGSNRPRTG